MKYIQKTEIPQFFINDTIELREEIKVSNKKSKIWDDFKEKRKLKEYILENEQNWLCGYCEAKLKDTFEKEKRENTELIHIEHIKPKHLDYDNLSFDYHNLLVSCSGKCFTEDKKPLTCGHRKGKEFNEKLFLNPTTTKDIRDYFIYTNNGYIGSSLKDKEKSKYTMELLELNTFDNKLAESRKLALKEFKKSAYNLSIKEKQPLKIIAKKILNKENLAFISFLRYRYKHIL